MDAPIVFVVDDDQRVRMATERLLRSAGYLSKTFSETQHVFASGRPAGPCCLVLDLRIPGENGLEFQKRLLERGIRIPIIFITGHAEVSNTVRAMKAGAVDFLTKPYDADDLLQAVARAIEVDTRLIASDNHRLELHSRYLTLTDREREVFAAVASGLLNKQIAAELGIAEKTVKVHRAHVMSKMGAVAVADAVRMSDLLGLHWKSSDSTPEYVHYATALACSV